MTEEDELFRRRMHFNGPPGFQPCTRKWPHDGPCAHIPIPATYIADYTDWIERHDEVWGRFAEALPCQDSNCCYRSPMCRNCSLVVEATSAIVGPPPYPGDYRDEP